MQPVIKKFPYNNDCAFLLGLDDLHPEGVDDQEGLDFGKDFNGRFWRRIHSLIEKVPDIKITFFTPVGWTDRSNFPSGIFWPLRIIYSRRREYNNGFLLNDKKYLLWLRELKKAIKTGNIFLSYHGVTHHNDNKKFAASQEFLGIDQKSVSEKIVQMINIGNRSHLPFENGFRSPGWGSPKWLNKILNKHSFLYTANSTDFISTNFQSNAEGTGLKGQNIYEITKGDKGILNITANCYADQIQRAVEIAKLNGIIVAHAHVAYTIFGIKHVNSHFTSNIEKMIKEIRNQTMKHIWFASFGELAAFFHLREKVTINKKTNNILIIKNPSDQAIRGLTIFYKNRSYVIDIIKPKSQVVLNTNSVKKEKKVSVILTVYNGQNHVIDSLQSLCNQSYSNIEIVVVNDGSTDQTKKILDEYVKVSNDERIKIIHQQNGGRSHARNNGFKKSTGQIITFCEDDAIYDRDYVKEAVKHFKLNDKKIAGVIGPHYVWNKFESLNTRIKDIERRRNFYNYKPQSTWFYKRDVFEKIGLFDETLELVEDVAPAILLRKKGYKFIYEPNSRWLHKEPSNIKKYLRRKFKGGIGMALLQKKKLRSSIVPLRYFIILTGLTLVFLIMLFANSQLLFVSLPFTIAFLFIVRYQAYKISRIVSEEKWYFILFAIMFEYIWWISTFSGYLYGMTLNEVKIAKILKGR